MPVTVSTTCQARFPDCCAPSGEVDLTLISNGEEPVQVYTPDRTLVLAGMPTPTVAATLTDAGGGGVLPAGNVAYLYVYASSAYPGVSADTTAGGFLWPKGQPSPVSLIYTNTVNHKINVTVTTSKRADIDKILIYRTVITTGATAPSYTSIVETAGQVFYVGFIQNNAAVATVTFADNVAATVEEMEVDNFAAPQFLLCAYVAPYWYGIGNFDLAVEIIIDAIGNLTASSNIFFVGRNGQFVTFDGITTGGFDGKGTFYFLYLSATVATVSVSQDLSTQDFPGYNGTTTMRVRGFSGTLYRSKAKNPFAWGYTQYQSAGSGQIRVTQQFAQVLGGYGVAIAVLPQQRLLKIDTERPSRSYAIDVSVPLESNFTQATRLLDSRYIVTAHHSQVLALLDNGFTAIRGFDSSNFAIVQSDSGGQSPISDAVKSTLRLAVTSGDTGRQFHGVFDAQTELSAFWFKTAIDPLNLVPIDTCLLYHGPSGQWSVLRDLDVTASASVYDPVTQQSVTLIGTANGLICQAFSPGVFSNVFPVATTVQPPQYNTADFIVAASGGALAGTYFDMPLTPAVLVRFWLQVNGVGNQPTAPANGYLFPVPLTTAQASDLALIGLPLVQAVQANGFSFAQYNNPILELAPFNAGNIPGASAGTTGWGFFQSSPIYPPGTVVPLVDASASSIGVWFMTTDPTGQNEQWARITAAEVVVGGVHDKALVTDAWFNPATLVVSRYPQREPVLGEPIFIGLIECEAQTYFQPSDTVSGQRVELWANQQTVDTSNQWARMYSEFDSGIYQSPFHLTQTKRGDGSTSSDNWTTGVNVPTGLMTQFGMRFIERGFGDYTLKSFTLMGK